MLNQLYKSCQNATQVVSLSSELVHLTLYLNPPGRPKCPQCKLQKSFPKYITIYSNNYLNSGSQLQLSEECKQSCTMQFSVFHFFSLPLLLLQSFTAQVNAINIELNCNTSKYYLEQISIEIFVVMIITVLYA